MVCRLRKAALATWFMATATELWLERVAGPPSTMLPVVIVLVIVMLELLSSSYWVVSFH